MKIINKYRIYLFISVLLLTLFGVLMIYSSSYIWAEYKFSDSFKYARQQTIFIILSFIIIFFINKVKSDFFYKYAKSLFYICLFFLIIVLIPGVGVIRNGSRSWFGVASFGIQPSEAMKISIVLITSKILSNLKEKKKIKDIISILFFLTFTFFLIMLQPDFGTGIIIVVTIISLLYVANLDKKFFIISFFIGICGVICLIIVAPYRLARILSFINPWNDPLGSGFQIIQSLYAIGPFGLLGVGLFNSMQKYFYLPEPQTDFIFSIICEEFGIIGAIFIIFMFFIIMYSCIKIATGITDKFKKYVIFGLMFIILFQSMMNISVVIGLIPITGVTLPFISYGGSSLLVSMTSVGIILNLSKSV